jgi:aspartyl-tRNA(Asn)/glutamyl-tRNA(Gln) amidotransferase subunit C
MLSKEEVRHIAKLARIALSERDIEKFQKELGDVLHYFELLKEAKVDNVPPMTYSVLLENIKREDVAQKKFQKDGQYLINQAPVKKNGYLQVKSIL